MPFNGPEPTKKNFCNVSRKPNDPYEIWTARSDSEYAGFVWHVLKKYRSPYSERLNDYSAWLCYVTSSCCPNGKYGDVYCSTIKANAVLTHVCSTLAEQRLANKLTDHGLPILETVTNPVTETRMKKGLAMIAIPIFALTWHVANS